VLHSLSSRQQVAALEYVYVLADVWSPEGVLWSSREHTDLYTVRHTALAGYDRREQQQQQHTIPDELQS
jgi:hypothetical protein